MGSGNSKKSKTMSNQDTSITDHTKQDIHASRDFIKGDSTDGCEAKIDDLGPASGSLGNSDMSDRIESILCQENDLKDGEMREFSVQETKIVLIKDKGSFYAIGGKCSHYGASLAKGAYSNGFVRCPWHGACFNVKTGDIEDFPGLDSVPSYEVKVENGSVKLIISQQQLTQSKRVRAMCKLEKGLAQDDAVVIIGGGGAAASCAESLRQNNYSGRIVMITQESSLPYDRPKLSKALDSTAESLQLRTKDFYVNNGIEIKMGQPVTALNIANKTVLLTDETTHRYKYLVLATGGRPRMLPYPGSDLRNIFYLRSPKDGKSIADAVPGRNVVIVGSSFIGMEVACWAIGKKPESVTVIDRGQTPYFHTFGPQIGQAIRNMFIEHGVKFRFSIGVERLVGDTDRNLTEVVLTDGTTLPADVLIAGIGVEPATSFLNGTGLKMNERGYVQVNKYMQTNDPSVYACGDIVQFPLSSFANQLVNIQHWQMALKHGKIAGQAIAGHSEDIKTVPFFWTVLFGKSIRYTGFAAGYDKQIIQGSVDELKFVAYFLKNDKLVAVATVQRDPVAAQIGECFRNDKIITTADIERDNSFRNNTDDWTHLLTSDTWTHL